MKFTILFSLFIATTLFTGCLSTPDSVQYHGKAIPAVSVTSNCKNPYPITQDCSNFSGPKRIVSINDRRGRVSASEDGTIVFVMAESVWTVDTIQVTAFARAVENHLKEKGFELIEITAMAAKQAVGGYFMVFSGDAYSELKLLTVE